MRLDTNELHEAKEEALRNVEEALNEALIVFGQENPDLRRALLDARGNIREAVGEART